MNKTRMTLAVMGGVIGLAVLAMAYFCWSAYAAKTAAMEGDDDEGVDGLETVVGKAQTLTRKPVYPCAESVKAIDGDIARVADWQTEAKKLAVRGDRVYPKTTPAAFKTFIVSDAKRLSALPGLVSGALVKPSFAFGPFKDYISEGKMPADAQLAELQRRWDDVATVVETLAACGIAELTDVAFKTIEVKEEPKDDRRNRKATKPRKPSADETAEKPPVAYTYVFSFAARPAALVKAVNALETCERFIVVDGFTFGRSVDALAEALGGNEKKDASSQASSRRGRRGRRAAAVEQPKTEEAKELKDGIVTDPAADAPFAVTMTVTIHDFRSLEGGEAK